MNFLWLFLQSSVVVTETLWPIKPKIFIVWSCTEKACWTSEWWGTLGLRGLKTWVEFWCICFQSGACRQSLRLSKPQFICEKKKKYPGGFYGICCRTVWGWDGVTHAKHPTRSLVLGRWSVRITDLSLLPPPSFWTLPSSRVVVSVCHCPHLEASSNSRIAPLGCSIISLIPETSSYPGSAVNPQGDLG